MIELVKVYTGQDPVLIRGCDSRPCEGTYVHTKVMVTLAMIRVHVQCVK